MGYAQKYALFIFLNIRSVSHDVNEKLSHTLHWRFRAIFRAECITVFLGSVPLILQLYAQSSLLSETEHWIWFSSAPHVDFTVHSSNTGELTYRYNQLEARRATRFAEIHPLMIYYFKYKGCLLNCLFCHYPSNDSLALRVLMVGLINKTLTKPSGNTLAVW